jgi:hypothetical protein
MLVKLWPHPGSYASFADKAKTAEVIHPRPPRLLS